MSEGREPGKAPDIHGAGRLEDGIRDLQAVMFDLDGTLIDSIPTYFRIAAAMLEEVGLPPAPREAVAAMLKDGLSGFHHLIPEDMAERRDELIAECLRAGKEISARLYPGSVTLIPGVEPLFLRLRADGVRMGIVSSSHAEFVGRKITPLKEAGIERMLDAVIVIEDTSEKKPSPEPVLACAERLGVEPSRCLFVGDADVDMKAGRRAGTLTVGVLTGVDDRATLEANGANRVLPSVRDLLPYF